MVIDTENPESDKVLNSFIKMTLNFWNRPWEIRTQNFSFILESFVPRFPKGVLLHTVLDEGT